MKSFTYCNLPGPMDNTETCTTELRKRKTKPTRGHSIVTRFSDEELVRLLRTAGKRRMRVEAWAREVILRTIEEDWTEPALMAEVVALRLLLNRQLHTLQGSESGLQYASTQIAAELRKLKVEISREVLTHYRPRL